MPQDQLAQWEEDAAVLILGAALIAAQLGCTTWAVLATVGVMFGVSAPRLWRHYVRGEPLRTLGGQWSSVMFASMILAMVATNKYI